MGSCSKLDDLCQSHLFSRKDSILILVNISHTDENDAEMRENAEDEEDEDASDDDGGAGDDEEGVISEIRFVPSDKAACEYKKKRDKTSRRPAIKRISRDKD